MRLARAFWSWMGEAAVTGKLWEGILAGGITTARPPLPPPSRENPTRQTNQTFPKVWVHFQIRKFWVELSVTKRRMHGRGASRMF